MTKSLAALLAAVVVVACCCPLAFGAFSGKSTAVAAGSPSVLGVSSNQSAAPAADPSTAAQKFGLSTADISSLSDGIDRSNTLDVVRGPNYDPFGVAGEYEVDWHVGKLTGDYSTHTNTASFYETGCTYGVAVDIALLDQYPMGTVFELSANGHTTTAVVNDCGNWWSAYGYAGRMFDLEPGTCDQLGWTSDIRNTQGVLTVTWRVISYG